MNNLTALTLGRLRGSHLVTLLLCALGCAKQGDKREFLGPPDSNPADNSIARVVVTPGIGTVQQSEPIAFGAFARRSGGDSVGVDVAWSASGGSVSASGIFSAPSTGTYWVVARSTARPDKADSASVFVVGPDNPVTSLSVSPKELAVRVGQTRQFTAVARLQDGAAANLPIYWSASGGTIDGTGLFSAVEPGSFLIIAVAATGLADTARVTIRNDAVLKTLKIEPAEVDVTEGTDEQFSVAAEWSDGTTTAPTVDYRTDGGTIDASGRFRALAGVGEYTVVANARGSDNLAMARIRIRTRTVVAVTVSPAQIKLSRGAWKYFTAAGQYSDGGTKLVSPTWSATGGTIDRNGVYRAGQAPGTYAVIASLSSTIADTAQVIIEAPTATLSSLVLSPSSATLAAGAIQSFSVAGTWSDGRTTAPAVTWSATGGSISAAGVYTAGAGSGSFSVIAKHEGGTRADTSVITITAPVVTNVVVAPSVVTVRTRSSAQFSASATMSDGSSSSSGGPAAAPSAAASAAPQITWTATGGSVSQDGLYTAGSATGTYQVIAQASTGAADTSLVTVAPEPAVLQQIVVTPGSATLQTTQGQQFVVGGVWTNGGSGVPNVTWTATGGTVSSTGFYSAGPVAGSFRVIATQQGGSLADTSAITITPPPPVLTGIALTPPTATVQAGSSQQFGVTGIWTNGGSGAPPVVYSATGGTVSSSGRFTAGSAAGTFRVVATQQGGVLADTSIVTVTAIPPQLVGISVDPSGVTLTSGQTQQYSATGVWTNGGSGAPAVTWTATGGTISSAGQFTAGSTAGTYRVVASQVGGTLADTVAVTVASIPPTLTDLQIQPKTVSMQTGLQQQFAPTATWSDGSTNVPAVVWTATGGSVTSDGLYTAPATAGTYRVVVRDGAGTQADTSTVTVVAPVVTQVTLTPGATSLTTGATQQYQTAITWSDGVSRPAAVNYGATGGVISGSGLYAAGSAGGNFRVTASVGSGSAADTSTVTLQGPPAPTLVSIAVSPGSASVEALQSRQFAASALWSDNSTTLPTISWTATGGTITSNGFFTAGSTPGTFRVIGTGGGVADTSVVTVTAPTLTSLTLSPGSSSLVTGGSQQFTAAAMWSNGATTSPTLTWAATGGAISGGLYSAGSSAGTYSVIVSGGGKADTAVVTLTAPPPPPAPGANNLYFNSAETGCGTDSNLLFCDDFEDGDWYSKNCDQANASGGLLQVDGWCGTIYNNTGLAAGTARCGGLGVRSNCAATTGNVTSTTGNMADHALLNGQGVNEIWVRFYTKALPGYQFGAEKMLTFNDGAPGGAGIRWGNLSWNCAGSTSSTGNVTMGFPVPMDVCQSQNVGTKLTITTGNWYFYEVHYKLSTPGQADGVFELWLDNCGPTGTTCPATPTLRMRRTDVRNARNSSSELIKVLWFEAWSNPESRGERYWDQIKASKVGPIGFMQ